MEMPRDYYTEIIDETPEQEVGKILDLLVFLKAKRDESMSVDVTKVSGVAQIFGTMTSMARFETMYKQLLDNTYGYFSTISFQGIYT